MSTPKMWISKILKIGKFLLIFLIITSWIFSSWPQIWQNPKIPPEIQEAEAAVANDAASESHTGTTGNTSAALFSWTHTPVGTPRGVLVFVTTISATKKVTSVTYGGVAMTEITGGAAVDTTTEPGRIDTFFLGTSVPTGAQTVTVNRTNDTTIMYAVAATVTAAANTEVYTAGIVLLQNDGTYAVQSVTDGSTGVDSVRYAAGYSGGAGVLVAGTGSTVLNSIDFGAFTSTFARETTAGQGARNVGFTFTTSDDRAGVHLAVRERVPSTTQSAYRFRNDDGSESAATWKAAENTAITDVSSSEIIRIRYESEETNSATTTLNAQLEFSSDATSCTTGTWTVLDTTTTAWRVTASANITNGGATTNQLTTSAITFAAGRIFDTQNQDATGVSLNNQHSEWEWAIRGDGAANGTTYRFRVTDAGTALNTYTNCAQLTTFVPTFTQRDYRWYENVNAIQPTTPLGGAAENAIATLTSTSSPIRLRANITVGTVALATSAQAFKLQYGYSTAGPWTDVGSHLGAGTGADGSVSTSTSANINTGCCFGSNRTINPDGIVTAVNANPTGTSISVISTTGFAAGDEILLMNLRGANGDTADVGNYEFLIVDSVPNATTLNFKGVIKKSYDGTTFSNQKVVVQRVPQWTSVTISSGGTLTANNWAGTSGGVIVFRASGTVTVNTGGSISANGLGYVGGTGATTTTQGGQNGESYDGSVGRGGASGAVGTSGGGDGTNTSANSNASRGGGGGGGSEAGADATNAAGGGGGGGYGGGGGGGGGAGDAALSGAGGSGGATDIVGGGGGCSPGNAAGTAGANAGGAAANAGVSPSNCTGGAAGSAGTTGRGGSSASGDIDSGGGGGGGGGLYGAPTLATVFLGSGGGGGGDSNDDATAVAGKGGDGGGIILIVASSFSNSGTISANGDAGANAASDIVGDGAGGGGSGGSIMIKANSFTNSGTFTSTGGAGGALGSGTGAAGAGGGSGGVGRIRIEAGSITQGTINPSPSTANQAIWIFKNNALATDGATITTTLLTASEKNESYEESNPTILNLSVVPIGQEGEWDFALDPVKATTTTYYFRMTKSDGGALNTYTNYPALTISAASTLTFTINVPSITFVGGLTPGTPISTSSVLTVNTNNSTGYNISLVRASTTETLFLTTDPSTRITDNPNGNNWTAPSATSTVGPSAIWTDGTTKSLGFRVKQTGTAANTYSSTWWGASDAGANARYSGISTSTATGAESRIVNTTLGSGSNENITVEYRVDVIGTQKSGAYISSPIIYTALVNP